MTNSNDNNGNGRKHTPLLVAVLGAFLGSSGTIAVYLGTPAGQTVARPDPFTGSQGAAIETRLDTLERRVDQLPPRELELAVEILRHDLETIERRIERLENGR